MGAGFKCEEGCNCKNKDDPNKQCYVRERHYEEHRRPEILMRRKYGIGMADVKIMEMQQRHACYLCKKIPEQRTYKKNGEKGSHGLVVDHNHETGKVRALLCQKCNITVGYYEKIKRLGMEAELEEYTKKEYNNGLGNI
jgi:hypothetical protein|tara:strand:- start:27 stop:443 length:417 start_codon:yes stop_codon:yes gene_type:complete